jgi:hypothetical protein
MIDLQTAADGVGTLRAKHKGGTEGVLCEVKFNHNQPMFREPGQVVGRPLEDNAHFLKIALDDGGTLEAPQRSFEAVE